MQLFRNPEIPDKVFLVNPVNADILSGTRRAPGPVAGLSGGMQKLMTGLVIVFIILVIGGLTWMAISWVNAIALSQRGVTADGYLVERFTDTIRGSTRTGQLATTYHWRYRFTTRDGQEITGDVQVSEEQYNAYEFRRPVQVAYLPDDSTVSNLPELNPLPIQETLIGGLLGLMGLFVGYALSHERTRRRRFQQESQLILGEIVKATISRGEAASRIYVNYQFQSPQSNALIARMKDQQRNDLRHAPEPNPGMPVAILYVNDRLFEIL